MSFRVRVRSVALAEFADATAWYAERSPLAAERFVSAMEATFAVLQAGADRFPLNTFDLRRVGVPHFPYSVYFRIRGRDCHIVAIIHGRRYPRRWQSRG